MKKRLLSLVLCLVMVFSLFPVVAMAADDEEYVSVGSGWNGSSIAAENENGNQLYVLRNGTYYPVFAAKAAYYEPVSSASNPLPITPENFPVSNPESYTSLTDGFLTSYYYRSSNGTAYQLKFKFLYHNNSGRNSLYYEYQFYTGMNNYYGAQYTASDTVKNAYNNVGNTHSERNLYWAGWYEYQTENHNNLYLELYKQFETASYYNRIYYKNGNNETNLVYDAWSGDVEAALAGEELYSKEAQTPYTAPAGTLISSKTTDAEESSRKDLYINKSLYLNNDGTYDLQLTAWSTGIAVTEEYFTPSPTDIVLVVDVSHSMHISRSASGDNCMDIVDDDGTPMYRIAAVKRVIENFITTMKAKDGGSNKYRISIVTFAGEKNIVMDDNHSSSGHVNGGVYVMDGDYTTGNDKTNYYYYQNITNAQYASSLKYLTTSGVAALENALGTKAFNTPDYNCTYPYNGLEYAHNVLNARTDAEKAANDAVVIMFTDGFPGGAENMGYVNYADQTINAANTLKKDDGADVYTVGIFNRSDATLLNLAGSNNKSIYSIKNYMEATSSIYPDATALNSTGTRTEGDYYQSFNTVDGQTAAVKDLDTAFQHIASAITGTTRTKLDADSVLRDVVNLDDFEVTSDASYDAAVYRVEKDSNGHPVWNDNGTPKLTTQNRAKTNLISIDEASDSSGNTQYEVHGFDYANDYIHNLNMKNSAALVVNIKGLLPKQGGALESNTVAGIYDQHGQPGNEVSAINVASPNENIVPAYKLIDFNGVFDLATAASGGKTNLTAELKANGGAFANDNSKVTYTLGKTLGTSGSVDISATGVDKAMVFGVHAAGEDAQWKQVHMLPSSTVYYSDTLSGKQMTSEGHGNSAQNTPAQDITVMGDQSSNILKITFWGTRIDAYCTTYQDSGYITAYLVRGDGTNMKDRVTNPEMINDRTTNTRANTPTVSYDVEYGQYTLVLYASKGAQYKFEGVRVYNSMNTNGAAYTDEVQNAYKQGGELNAITTRFRDILINNEKAASFDNASAIEGALYIDTFSKADSWGIGTDTSATFDAYQKDGPKQELYLNKDQGLTFMIEELPADAKIYIGLSAPEGGSSIIKVTHGDNATQTIPVSSVMDMYYEVTPTSTGTITIKNDGGIDGGADAMIALTNIRIAEGTKPLMGMKFSVKRSTLAYAAQFDSLPDVNDEPDPGEIDPPAETEPPVVTPEPTQQPSIVNLINQIISNFVNALFGSIARLFGH